MGLNDEAAEVALLSWEATRKARYRANPAVRAAYNAYMRELMRRVRAWKRQDGRRGPEPASDVAPAENGRWRAPYGAPRSSRAILWTVPVPSPVSLAAFKMPMPPVSSSRVRASAFGSA